MRSTKDKFFRLVAKILNVAHPTLILDITILLKFLQKPELIKNQSK